MKILILAPYPLDEAPSQRFRFEQFLKFMEEYELKWDFQPFVFAHDWKTLYQKGKTRDKIFATLNGFARRTRMLFFLRNYDFILIHREVTPFGPPLFEWFITKILKKKIIYDFDDAIWLPDKNESTTWKWLKWRSKVKSICSWSYKVSVGNEYLADFARQYGDRVDVIPTVVDTVMHNPVSQKPKANLPTQKLWQAGSQKPVIGWTGSHSTLFYLDVILPVLQQLEKDYEFTFLVIANKNPHLPLTNFQFINWKKETEIEDLAQIDIGVMPLEDSEWAKGKCGFKLIQYLAMEIPAVASPVGVNPDIIKENETGFLASSPDQWIEKLTSLLNNEKLRKRIGAQGRKLIITKYSVESQLDTFLQLFS